MRFLNSQKYKKGLTVTSLIWFFSFTIFIVVLIIDDFSNPLSGFLILASFGIGSVTFLIMVNYLPKYVNNKAKVTIPSFIFWVTCLIAFFYLISTSGDTTTETDNTQGILVVITLALGTASFVTSFLAVISRDIKEESKTENSADRFIEGTLSKKFASGLDDIIFVPNKKANLTVILLLGVVLVGLVVIILSFLFSELGTNEYNQEFEVTPKNNLLSITDYKIEDRQQTQHLVGIVKNNSLTIAKDVILRVDFSKDEAGSQKFDTRYFSIDYIAPQGAYSYDFPFTLNYTGQYWWSVRIDDTD
jgi:flagellar basal body-associated protein FliL